LRIRSYKAITPEKGFLFYTNKEEDGIYFAQVELDFVQGQFWLVDIPQHIFRENTLKLAFSHFVFRAPFVYINSWDPTRLWIYRLCKDDRLQIHATIYDVNAWFNKSTDQHVYFFKDVRDDSNWWKRLWCYNTENKELSYYKTKAAIKPWNSFYAYYEWYEDNLYIYVDKGELLSTFNSSTLHWFTLSTFKFTFSFNILFGSK
jgi:hypothetical protein